MALERALPFDFTTSIVSVSEFRALETLPPHDPSPPLLSSSSIQTKLEELFQGNALGQLEDDSMALAPETLQVLARESLRSLIGDLATLVEAARGVAPSHEIERASQLLQEESVNQELLSAFRRAVMGG